MQYWEGMAVSMCVANTVAKARPVRVRGPFALVCALLLLLQCLIIPSQRMRDNNLYSELFRTLLDQYSFVACGIGKDLAQVRFDRAMEAINRNRDTIEEVGEYFGVPPENIAAVLLKEQFTRSAPDFLVVAFAPLRNGKGSTGLGAVTADTAKKAYAYFNLSSRLPSTNQAILRLFMEDEYEAIFATACVLSYEAAQFGYGYDDFTHLDLKKWHRVYNKYNGDIEYANKTVEYLPELAEMF